MTYIQVSKYQIRVIWLEYYPLLDANKFADSSSSYILYNIEYSQLLRIENMSLPFVPIIFFLET